MASLSAADILRVWETASAQPPMDRALTILAAAAPATACADLARLSIGERDARLLDVRERTFGRVAAGAAACARCGERVEFTLALRDVRTETGPAAGEVEADGWTLRFRAPNTEDVAAAVRALDPRRALAARCVVEARRDGAPVSEPDLPASVVSRLAAAMAESDPQAEVLLDYACPACGQPGQTLFDIAAFLWDEVRAEARRLLIEVATLARAFGWRETEILALSPARRRAYLELVP